MIWSPLATARLREIRAYVALDKPRAAERLAMRIVSGQYGLRELTVGGTPYVIFYRLRRSRVLVSTIHPRPNNGHPADLPLISSPQSAIAPSPLYPARP
jgi:plasmid stabilization system protein ParE